MFTSSVFSTLIKGKLASLALRFLSGKSPVLGTCLLSPFLFYHFTFLRLPPCFVFLPFSPQIQSPFHSLSLVLLPIFRGTCWMPELKTLNEFFFFRQWPWSPQVRIYLLGENPCSILISSEKWPNTLVTSKEEIWLPVAKAASMALLFWAQYLLCNWEGKVIAPGRDLISLIYYLCISWH